MIIRVARAGDAQTISELWRELVAHHQLLDEAMPIAADDGKQRYAERIRYTLDDFNSQVYVADDNGDLVGYVLGTVVDLLPDTFQEQTAGMVADIYVKASRRSEGIGASLMRVMKDWFRLRDVDHYEWYVAASNETGVAFWRDKMGGRPIMLRMRAPITQDEDEQ